MAYDMQKLQRMATGMARTQTVMDVAKGIRDDYMQVLEGLDDEARAVALPPVHLRSAHKLLTIARDFGGIYNKAAQFAASLRGPIPREYTDTLAEVTDRAPFKPFDEIDVRFVQEFQRSARELFAAFEEVPLAAASLAQVHRARLSDGRAVAVKVQYPGLAEQIEADLEVIETMLKMFQDKLPFDMGWLLNDFRGYLRKEVNFCEEADNARKVKQHFAYNDRVYVPQPVEEYSTSTVLTLEFAEGCRKVNDLRWLAENRIRPCQVADLLTEISGTMVFVTGFVHGDPHAGNVYVRAHPVLQGPQIVLLDHGLYHELGEETRVSLCRLWQASFANDRAQKEALCHKFAGPMAHFFPLLLSEWFVDTLTLQEAADLHAGRYYHNVDLQELVSFLAGMEEQKSLLGMLHSTGYTRFLLHDLHYSEHRRLTVTARHVLAGLDPEVQAAVQGGRDPVGLARLRAFDTLVRRALRRMQFRIRFFALCFLIYTHWIKALLVLVVAVVLAGLGAALAWRPSSA